MSAPRRRVRHLVVLALLAALVGCRPGALRGDPSPRSAGPSGPPPSASASAQPGDPSGQATESLVASPAPTVQPGPTSSLTAAPTSSPPSVATESSEPAAAAATTQVVPSPTAGETGTLLPAPTTAEASPRPDDGAARIASYVLEVHGLRPEEAGLTPDPTSGGLAATGWTTWGQRRFSVDPQTGAVTEAAFGPDDAWHRPPADVLLLQAKQALSELDPGEIVTLEGYGTQDAVESGATRARTLGLDVRHARDGTLLLDAPRERLLELLRDQPPDLDVTLYEDFDALRVVAPPVTDVPRVDPGRPYRSFAETGWTVTNLGDGIAPARLDALLDDAITQVSTFDGLPRANGRVWVACEATDDICEIGLTSGLPRGPARFPVFASAGDDGYDEWTLWVSAHDGWRLESDPPGSDLAGVPRAACREAERIARVDDETMRHIRHFSKFHGCVWHPDRRGVLTLTYRSRRSAATPGSLSGRQTAEVGIPSDWMEVTVDVHRGRVLDRDVVLVESGYAPW